MNKGAIKFIQVYINIHLKSVWHLAKATVKTLLVRSSCLTPKPNLMLHSPQQLPEGLMSGGCEMHCWWYEKHKSRWMTRQYFCESSSNWLSVPAMTHPPQPAESNVSLSTYSVMKKKKKKTCLWFNNCRRIKHWWKKTGACPDGRHGVAPPLPTYLSAAVKWHAQ